jgi:hypothetical protein
LPCNYQTNLTRPNLSKVNAVVLAVSSWFVWNYWLPLFIVMSIHIYDKSTSDFLANFYTAGQSWLSRANPYANPHIVFPYTPASLPFFGLFALLDYDSAALLWMITYLSFFLVALVALALTVRSERRSLFVCLSVLLFFSSFPVLRLIELSQADLLIASLTILSFVTEKRGHRYLSAFLLSAATVIKIEPVFLLVYFVIFRKDLKYLGSYLTSLATIAGVSLLTVPVQWYWYYVVNVAPTLYSQYSLESDQSIVHFLWLAGLNKPILQAVSIVGVGLFAIFAFCVASSKWTDFFGKSLRADAMFLMNGLAVLFFSPRALVYPYAWTILPLAYFLSGLLMQRVKSAYLVIVGVATFLLGTEPTGYYGWALSYYYEMAVVKNLVVPTIAIGNAILILSLTVLFLRPNSILTGI